MYRNPSYLIEILNYAEPGQVHLDKWTINFVKQNMIYIVEPETRNNVKIAIERHETATFINHDMNMF